ncbi:MAG: ZIP family metal transporter [Firmicutes bacterium]|nr:ZIP family metal transporter [Bacillota bacterium]
MWLVLIVSALAGLMIGLGGAIASLSRRPREKSFNLILGFAAGVMAGTIAFDLLPEAWRAGRPMLIGLGLLVGWLAIYLLEAVVPHPHAGERDTEPERLHFPGDGHGHSFHHHDHTDLVRTSYLIGLGIVLHNGLEGMAVGAGSIASEKIGVLLAGAIALHNIPIGMAIAAPLKMAQIASGRVILATTAAGLFTPLGTWIGLAFAGSAQALAPFLLSVGGGTMMYILANELLPKAFRYHRAHGIIGVALGVASTLIIK